MASGMVVRPDAVTYSVGDALEFEGVDAEVVDVRSAGNPAQGRFTVCELRLASGETRLVALPGDAQEPGAESDRADLEMPAGFSDALGTGGGASLLSLHVLTEAVAAARAELAPAARACMSALQGLQQVGELGEGVVQAMSVALGWSVAALEDGVGAALFADDVSRDRALSRAGRGEPVAQHAEAIMMRGASALRLVGAMWTAGVTWGILIDAEAWRLYRAAWDDPDVGSTLGEYHHVDVAPILRALAGDGLTGTGWEAFLRWYVVFRARSFEVGADGLAPIERMKRESAAEARRAVAGLRAQVHGEVLPTIVEGFARYRHERLGSDETVDALLAEPGHAALVLIHRLLYILYAEGHGWLPMAHPDYRGQSLSTLARRAWRDLEDGRPLSEAVHATPLYDGLAALFERLEYGAAALGLPSYGGGLFGSIDPVGSFLARHRLADRDTARMLAGVAYVADRPIDYGLLSLRHLGVVGEGLVESYRRRTARSNVAWSADRHGDAPRSVPVPDFVSVSAIERAVLEVLEGRRPRFARAMDEVVRLRRALQRAAEGAGGDGSELVERLAQAEADACDVLLDVKILDPAMETGLFLICALDGLVDGIAGELATYHRDHPWVPWAWNPVAGFLAQARTTISEAVSQQGLAVGPDLLDDGVILARVLAQRALYGVDLDPVAVEIGKGNLSMRAFAVGAPWIVLEHHVRCGDSLTSVAEGVAYGAPPSGREGKFSWATAFPDVLGGVSPGWSMAAAGESRASSDTETRQGFDAETRQGFDVIVGSPPSWSSSVPPSCHDGEDAEASFGASAPLSTAFLAQSRRLVRESGGRIAFVITPLRSSGEQVPAAPPAGAPDLEPGRSEPSYWRGGELKADAPGGPAFRVTDDDLLRVERRMRRTRQAETLTELVRQLAAERLDGDVGVPAARRAAELLREAEAWRHQAREREVPATDQVRLWGPRSAWHAGDIGLFAVEGARGQIPVVGEVLATRGPGVVVQLDGHPQTRIFGTAVEGPGRLRIEAWRQGVIDLVTDLAAATDEAACVDYVLWHCGDVVLTELLHTLRHDVRFVSLNGRWFLRRYVTRPPAAHLEALARTVLLTAEHPLTTEALLEQLSPLGTHDDGDLFGLAQALIERPDLFANAAEGSRARWVLAGPPSGPFTARYAAYDPATRALLCEPGDALSPEVIERLWALELLPPVVARM